QAEDCIRGFHVTGVQTCALPICIVSELRQGMGLAPRLFPFPAAILDAAARMAGRGHMARALLGDLQVDASRFRETFGFAQSHGQMGRASCRERVSIAAVRAAMDT